MRKNISRFLFGILFITAAVFVFGDSIGWWTIMNYDGWWTVFLIVPGVAGLINNGFNLWSTCLVLIGTWFLASEQHWIPSAVSDSIIWVVILLLIGLKLVLSSFRKNKIPSAPVVFDGVKSANDISSTIDYTAVFGSVEVSNNSRTLCSGTVSAIFGGATVDLRDAVPVDGAIIEANAVFGGVEILVPLNCRLQVSGVPFFGGCECYAQRPNDTSLPLLTIKYTSVFGGVEIK